MGRANASRSVARGTRFCHILEHDLVELQAFWTISYIKSMIYGEASYLINVVTLLSMPNEHAEKNWGYLISLDFGFRSFRTSLRG